jgi:cell division transport system permease protein
MLLLLAGFWIIQTGLLAGLEFTEEKVQVVAYLQQNATEGQITALAAEIQQRPDVESVDVVTRDKALERFRESMEAQGRTDLTQQLDSNPLFASVEVKLKDPSSLRAVTEALSPTKHSIVRNVINIEDLVERLLTVTNVLRTFGTGVIGAIVLFIVINTIRLAVLGRAEEIEVMRLVGASDAFIRWPFVFEGAFVGFLGAVVTLAILAAAADQLNSFMVEFFRVLPLQVGSLTRDLVTLVMGAGVGLGILGSWVSVRTYLIR